MANPSPAAVDAIRARVAAVSDWSKPPEAVLADLEADAVPNPVSAAPTLPKPFTVASLMACVVTPATPPAPDAAALSKIYSRAAVTRFADDVARQDRGAVLNWLQLAYISGDVSQAQYGAMAAVVSAVTPDPAWTPTIPSVQATIGRPVDVLDVILSRPEA